MRTEPHRGLFRGDGYTIAQCILDDNLSHEIVSRIRETITFCHSRESGNPVWIPDQVGDDMEEMKTYYVYILASKPNGTLYIGVTSDLVKRIHEHKTGAVPGFTKKYGVHTLVYYEQTNDVHVAIEREKQLKKWNRAWKLELIERRNPNWHDLYDELTGPPLSRG